MAYREQQRQHFADAKRDIEAVKTLAKELDDMGDDAELIEEAYRENTGRDLVVRSPVENSGILADDQMPIIPARRFNAEAGAVPPFRGEGGEG